MVCEKCIPEPGKLIRVDNPKTLCCIECGEPIQNRQDWIEEITRRWDNYFLNICKAVASKSPCLSRKIGAILVRDKSIVSTGYNGPPRGVPHCGHERFIRDKSLQVIVDSATETFIKSTEAMIRTRLYKECPRRVLGYKSGTHMELCPAQHAEQNAISNAARLGVSTTGTILYMNCVIPCKNCFGALINAGITEVVIENKTLYDENSRFIVENSDIKIREFKV